MSLGLFLTIALFVFVSLTFSLPSGLRQLAGNGDSITFPINVTTPNPHPAYKVLCFNYFNHRKVVPADCSYVLNEMILQEPEVFKERRFFKNRYRTEAGGNAQSRWWRNDCEVTVNGHGEYSTMLTLFQVALTANKIMSECVNGMSVPLGGVSPIGDLDDGFVVMLHGFLDLTSISEGDSHVSNQSAMSVSKRAIRPEEDSETSRDSRGIEARQPVGGISRISNHLAVAVNSTISVAGPTAYTVHCFNPLLLHLPPAVAADCGFVINFIILRLFNPTIQLTFGYTDAADINLSKLHYQKWQHGQCMISVKNNDARQVDSFRMIDVATAARRITMECVVASERKMGGVASIGTDGKGFYVYVGGQLASSPTSGDVMLLNDSSGVQSS